LLEELLRPKNGIEIQNSVNLGTLRSGQKIDFKIPIKNSGRDEIRLISAKVSGHSDGSIETSHIVCPKIICPNETFWAKFEFVAKNFGRNKILIVFKFRLNVNDEESGVFSCGMHVLAEVVDPEFSNLAPTSNSGDFRKFTNVRYLRDGERVKFLD
jgi:hypothetical protein